MAQHVLRLWLNPNRTQPLPFEFICPVKGNNGEMYMEYVTPNWDIQSVPQRDFVNVHKTLNVKKERVLLDAAFTIRHNVVAPGDEKSEDYRKMRVCKWLMEVHPLVKNTDDSYIDQVKLKGGYERGDRFLATYTLTKSAKANNVLDVRSRALAEWYKLDMEGKRKACIALGVNISNLTHSRINYEMVYWNVSKGTNDKGESIDIHELGKMWEGENASKFIEYIDRREGAEMRVAIQSGLILSQIQGSIGGIGYEVNVGYKYPKINPEIATPEMDTLRTFFRENQAMYERLLSEVANHDWGLYDDLKKTDEPKNAVTESVAKKQATNKKATVVQEEL